MKTHFRTLAQIKIKNILRYKGRIIVLFVQSIQMTLDYGINCYWVVYMLFRREYPTKIKTYMGSMKNNMDFVNHR